MSHRQRDDTRSTKPRMYQPLWELIAKNTSDKPVTITCPVRNQDRVVQAVKKEKTIANTLRRDVDAVGFGRLVIKRDGNKVSFHLLYNGDMI